MSTLTLSCEFPRPLPVQRRSTESSFSSALSAHSVEWNEAPGKLSKIPIDENKIPEDQRIPRVTTASWKYENGAVGQFIHAVALQGIAYSCELEVYADGYQLRCLRAILVFCMRAALIPSVRILQAR